MRRPVLSGLLLALAAAPAAGQTRPQPQLLLTIFGGLSTGASLWTIDRQPFARRSDAATLDTLSLMRSLQSALTLGASATVFPHPSLGLTGEIAYLGHDLDDGCEVRYLDPSTVNPGETEALCGDIRRHGVSAVSLAFSVGAVYRVASRAFASPYVRAQVGITARSASTVELQGRFLVSGQVLTRVVLEDEKGGAVNPTAAGGLGVMIPIGPGYQVRLELRDQLLLVRTATGPAGPGGVEPAPTGSKLVHSPALLLQLDIVLEQRRGRRY
jgi:hypothetical protein